MPEAPNMSVVNWIFLGPRRSMSTFAARLLLVVIIASQSARYEIRWPIIRYISASESSLASRAYGLPSTMLWN